jgi:hypothetical protein
LHDGKAIVKIAFQEKYGFAMNSNPHSNETDRLLRERGFLIWSPGVRTPIVVSDDVRDVGVRVWNRKEVPPQGGTILRVDKRVGATPQKAFERDLKAWSSLLNSQFIPWCFIDNARSAWKLDQGRVGHAIANGVLAMPSRRHRAWFVELVVDDQAFSPDPVARVAGQRLRRPGQTAFKLNMLAMYGRCAVTGCSTLEALEAAHIKVVDGQDLNSADNGLLLRRDIHSLLDRYLITLSKDGRTIETSSALTDLTYADLRGRSVALPEGEISLNLDYVADHRRRFKEHQENVAKATLARKGT